MAKFLTPKQKAILDFIAEFQADRGVAPTHREICERFGFNSYGTAYKHLRLLAAKGYLRRESHQRRGMELLPPAAEGGSAGGLAPAVPFLGRIAAGRPIEAIPESETLPVPQWLLGGRPKGHFVLRVAGNSMIDEGIHDGDWVVVERREQASPGEAVVALVGEEVTLKRFYPEGDLVRLQPANPSMPAIRVPAGDVQIQGVVVGLMRRF